MIYLRTFDSAASISFRITFKSFTREHKLQVMALFEPRLSGRKADKVISKLGFPYSFRVEAHDFSGGLWFLWNEAVDIEITHISNQFIQSRIWIMVYWIWVILVRLSLGLGTALVRITDLLLSSGILKIKTVLNDLLDTWRLGKNFWSSRVLYVQFGIRRDDMIHFAEASMDQLEVIRTVIDGFVLLPDINLFPLLLWLPWSFFILGGDSQLLNSQAQVLLQLKKHLEYPKQLDIWYDRRTLFCTLPPSPNVNVSCEFNSVTELKIMGDKLSIEFTDFHGFPVSNRTLSDAFSMDSFVTTLSRLPRLKVLALISLGIWGPLPDKIHRLSSLESLDLSSNFLFGSIPPKVSTMVKLQTLVFDHNSSMIQSPTETTRSHRLNTTSTAGFECKQFRFSLPTIPKGLLMVSLEKNAFTGEIPAQYAHLTQLQHIDISFNKLSGTIPAPLFSLPNISFLNLASNVLSESLGYNITCGTNLGFVDISNNRLSGSLPSCLNFESGNKVVNFDGNCLSIAEHHRHHNQHPESYCRDEVHKNRSNPNARGIGVSVGLIVGIAVISVLLAIAFVIVCRHYCHRGISEQHLLHKSVQEKSTTGFSSEILTNAMYISDNAKLGAQGLPPCRSFTLEELKEATNNFDNSAFLGEENCVGRVMNWSERLAVLIGVCKAVQFLHIGVIPGFFHNRLKTNNILLNQHRMAKLGDYGLSIVSEETNNDTAKGEDPHKSWQMTRLEDDVYSFGLILLETMLGSSIATKMEATLRHELTSLSNQDGQARLMNPVVSATGSQESLSAVISIANKCICQELWSRPSFEDILWNLQYAAQIQANADSEPRFSSV
ncbi:Leucine-rich repeat protein kinase family protein isoform 6 [Hibiscus syriacus]|uniref:Leucine-rich repeat protein kinase family protein isoform 6 n=1 Tax=Hibiscus syriacus TaxID=106335 RepID=A0A6A2X9X5_HIBSY|nr:Leucine-rich repeat protein kinase family protein isoform 6 [Hibiscus syriacus]